MRKVVALVETRREDGRTIASDAFSLSEESVPVCWDNDFTNVKNLMGNASELRIQGNEVTMEIELNDRYKNMIDDVEFFVWANELVEKDKRVEYAVIRAVSAAPFSGHKRIE
jgi:hypothetical protein